MSILAISVKQGESTETPALANCGFIRKLLPLHVTKLYLGFVVIAPNGFSIEAALEAPNCWSMNTGVTILCFGTVVIAGHGSSTPPN